MRMSDNRRENVRALVWVLVIVAAAAFLAWSFYAELINPGHPAP